jgi:hypothetical protein
MRTFWMAVSRVKGGKGGRDILNLVAVDRWAVNLSPENHESMAIFQSIDS